MASTQLTELELLVWDILKKAAGKPLTIAQIEQAIPSQMHADTFDVRDAVWKLVAEQRAEFTPRRQVKWVDTTSCKNK